MLTGLDDIDWSKLRHAYGAADDVPRQLRSLTSADAGIREAALDALYGNLWHQGTLYPATPVAVPFLLALAGDAGTADRGLLLLLLADIGRSATFGDEPWYGDALTALEAGVETLQACLSSDDEVERIAAIVTMAWASDGTALAKRLPCDDEGERLVILYALAAGRANPPVEVLERFANFGRPATRLAARLGLLRAGVEGALGQLEPEGYAVLSEVIGTVASQALPQPVELLDPATIGPEALNGLCEVLTSAQNHRTALPIVELTLAAAFQDGYEEPPTPMQMRVLTAIGKSSGAWVYPGNTTAALAEHGIEAVDREDLCSRLGIDPPEAPEREDTATLLATEAAGVRWEELSRNERDLLERFVDTLDTLGWNDVRNWHKFVTGGSGFAISPIGVGRHFNERAVLECTLWLYDEHTATETGERTGESYVKLHVADKGEHKAPVAFRAYIGDRLDAVLRIVDRHRPTIERDKSDAFLHDLFTAAAKVEIETADGRILEIRPKASPS